MMNQKYIKRGCLIFFIGWVGTLSVQAETIPLKRVNHLSSGIEQATVIGNMNSIDLKSLLNKEKGKAGIKKQRESMGDTKTEESKKMYAGPDILVGLLTGQTEIYIRTKVPFQIENNRQRHGVYKANSDLRIRRSRAGVEINGTEYKGTVWLNPGHMDPSFSLKGNTYRGKIKICPSTIEGKVNVINSVPLEIYLQGVVPCEIVPSWSMDAIKAQAVAARTYALYHRNGYEAAGYDVTDDTRSQVYRGYSAEAGTTNRAVKETEGEIMTYQGKPIDALFHANGGGYTENSEDVWGSYIPYLRGVKEEKSPTVSQSWNKTISLSDFSEALLRAGYHVGKIRGITLSHLTMGNRTLKDRGISGRVKYIEITGTRSKERITGSAMQTLFGLKSTLFDVSVRGKDLIFTGYGFGHGLGLSQWGAEALAAKYGNGKDYYRKILAHYFTGIKIEKIY